MIKFWNRDNSNGHEQAHAEEPQVVAQATIHAPRDGQIDEHIEREIRRLARDQGPGHYRVRVRRMVVPR